jgi:ubiquinone/menaquinone biosynthesis C-methylase UbiE
MRQRGRASLEFAGSLSKATNDANRQIATWLGQHGLDDSNLEADLDRRQDQISAELREYPTYSVATLSADWLWANHGRIGKECLEEIIPDVHQELDRLDDGPTTLSEKVGFKVPGYFAGQWFHNTTGGWDGHRYMGTIQAEVIHKHYVAAKYGSGLYQLRRCVLDQLPEHPYRRILDMGASAGYLTREIADKFPDAEIHGCDLSKRMLEQARRVGNELGASWQLLLAPAEDTGLEGESFDLVTSYALFHEIPGPIIKAVWQEAFRLLRPGGYALMADGIPGFDTIDRLTAWRYYHDWQRGGEPYAKDYATMDDSDNAKSAGFVDVEHRTLDSSRSIPRLTIARKPLGGTAS